MPHTPLPVPVPERHGEEEVEAMARKFGMLFSASTIAALWTLLSVVSALAGDGQGPWPK